jgi:hypothetical protein
MRYVYVIDQYAPVFEEQGNTYTYECGEEIPVIQPSANDNCSTELTYTYFDGAVMSSDSIAGYSSEGIYLDLRDLEGLVTVSMSTSQESGIFHFINIPNVDYIPENAGTRSYTLQGGQVYGPCTAPYGTLYIGEETPAGGIRLIIVEEGGDDWNDMVLTINTGRFSRLNGNAVAENPCDQYFTRTWTAADECGNSSNFDQYITIVDTQAPVVNPYTMAIDMPCDAVSNNIMISAEDCNEVVITYTDEYVSGGCAGKIMRTYAVSDVCGNQTTGLIQQIITLIDVTAPTVATAPADVEIECGEEAPAYSPIWNDNCDQELSLSDSSSITSDACTSVIYQSWTASDACGNSTTVSRTITIVDSTAPEFTSVPQNENRECTQQDVVAPAYAIDNCSDVTITHSDVVTGGQCAANYTIERTYRATDECGNYADYMQTINVSDNYGPIWSENQSQFVYECGSDA